jgi:hypothetical protein
MKSINLKTLSHKKISIETKIKRILADFYIVKLIPKHRCVKKYHAKIIL